MSDPLPCPFCGGPATTNTFETESLFSHDQVEYLSIDCADCDITMSGEQQDEIRAAWNLRAPAASPAIGPSDRLDEPSPSPPPLVTGVESSSISQSAATGVPIAPAATGSEPSGAKGDTALLGKAWGALNFILAFYEPGQRYLDTEAWKNAEAGGKLAHDALSERLGNTPGWWRR